MNGIKFIRFTLLSLFLSITAVFASGSSMGAKIKSIKTYSAAPAALLMESYRYMGALESFSVSAVTTNDDYFNDDMIVTYTHHVHIDLQRPGYLHVQTYGDLKAREYYLKEGAFTVYDADLNYFAQLRLPQNVDKALDILFEKYGMKTALANILYSDLYKRTAPVNKGYYFGLSEVDDVSCHHIGFESATQEFQVWIEKSKTPLIRKFMVIDRTEAYLPRSSTLIRWKLDPELGTAVFEFHAPSAAKKIDIELKSKSEE